MRVPTGSFARILLSMIAHVTAGPGSWRVFMHPKGRPPSGGWRRKKSEKKRFVCLYRRQRFFSASVPTSRLFYGWNKFFRDCLFLLPHPTHYSLPSLEKKFHLNLHEEDSLGFWSAPTQPLPPRIPCFFYPSSPPSPCGVNFSQTRYLLVWESFWNSKTCFVTTSYVLC